jgi:hypothetical protein
MSRTINTTAPRRIRLRVAMKLASVVTGILCTESSVLSAGNTAPTAVTFTLSNGQRLERNAEPIRCGLPLVREFARRGEDLTLFGPDGRTVPVQLLTTGTYHDGTPRWVLLDFQATVPTVIKAEVKWQAVILGAEYHVVYTADRCDWVTIDGFEVMGGRYDGVKISGDYSVVRNCWVHNNKAMRIAMHNSKGGTIENNLIEFNGDHVQFDHGVYADGEGLTLRGNIVRHNASYGLHLYPSIKN